MPKIYFLLLLPLFWSCETEVFYEKTYSFPKQTWKINQKPSFSIDIKDTAKVYNLFITLRTTTDYAFNNCWIYLNTKTPNNEKAREPFEIKIAKPDGTWIGQKSGTIVEHVLGFKQRKFPQNGKYQFKLEQAVVQDELEEILDIGVRVEEVQTGRK